MGILRSEEERAARLEIRGLPKTGAFVVDRHASLIRLASVSVRCAVASAYRVVNGGADITERLARAGTVGEHARSRLVDARLSIWALKSGDPAADLCSVARAEVVDVHSDRCCVAGRRVGFAVTSASR